MELLINRLGGLSLDCNTQDLTESLTQRFQKMNLGKEKKYLGLVFMTQEPLLTGEKTDDNIVRVRPHYIGCFVRYKLHLLNGKYMIMESNSYEPERLHKRVKAFLNKSNYPPEVDPLEITPLHQKDNILILLIWLPFFAGKIKAAQTKILFRSIQREKWILNSNGQKLYPQFWLHQPFSSKTKQREQIIGCDQVNEEEGKLSLNNLLIFLHKNLLADNDPYMITWIIDNNDGYSTNGEEPNPKRRKLTNDELYDELYD